jgi:hypothetical protein
MDHYNLFAGHAETSIEKNIIHPTHVERKKEIP